MRMIEFDTRNTKPKLYNLLVLTVIVFVAVGWLLLDSKTNTVPVSLILEFYFAAALVLLIRAFIGQLQYNPYSYNTIIYAGFSLYVAFVLIVDTILTVRIVRSPGLYRETDLIDWMVSSSMMYILVTFPFIVAFSVFLCLSNIFLIRREGKRIVNLLGIVLSVLLTGGVLLIIGLDLFQTAGMRKSLAWMMFINILSSVYFYMECMMVGSVIAGLIAAAYKPKPDKDVMILLGCGLKKDGTPTPLLRGRIDAALRFYREQKAQTGRELTFVCSGGRGPDEVIAESSSMKQYLISQGIPERMILEENQSSSTFENMKFSKERMTEAGLTGKIAFVTTNYHVFRSGLCARRVKMRALGLGAKTKWYFWPNAWVREFVGLLTEHRGKQGMVFGGLILINILLTLYSAKF